MRVDVEEGRTAADLTQTTAAAAVKEGFPGSAADVSINTRATPPTGRDKLPGLLQEGGFDWLAVTSPEAAAVFLEGWNKAGRPEVRAHACGQRAALGV